jgi:hypothetical protein
MEALVLSGGFEEAGFPPCFPWLCAFGALVDLFLEMPWTP